MNRQFYIAIALFLALGLVGCTGSSRMLQVTTTDNLQNRVPDATVRATMLQSPDGEIIAPIEQPTGATGTSEFRNMKMGEYKIEVEKTGYAPAAPKTVWVAESKTDLSFTLYQQVTLKGVVLDTDEQTPILEASITIEKADGDSIAKKTDANGEFTVENLYPNETYTVRAFFGERQVEMTNIQVAENETIKLVLPATGHKIYTPGDIRKYTAGGGIVITR